MQGIRWLWAVLAGVPLLAAANTTAIESDAARFLLEPVTGPLKEPVAMTFLPDGRALVADRAAPAMELLDVRTGKLTPLAGLPPMLVMEDSGLLDVVLHPDYAKNGWIYFSYSEGEPHYSTTVVDRARLDGDRLVARERILTADAWSEDSFHYGRSE